MRTSKYYKLLASMVLVSTITLSTSNVFAQRRVHNEEAARYEERKRNKPLYDYNKRDRYKKSIYKYDDDRKSHKKDNRSKHKKSYYQES
ncbi:hypothetical protein [Marinifilum sp.]|uniref:hypothetical protein n=1 Tax=Marinifilum sp. TaxID=2033137 RepID=UPI003BAAF0C9